MDFKEKLSIFNEFGFEIPPVALKFSPTKPQGIEQLDGVLDFCEMLSEAQKAKAFYATKENFSCVAPFLLGMKERDPVFESGCVGPFLGAFKDSKANQRVYYTIPKLHRGTVNYVMFAPINDLNFEPDVLIFTAKVNQAEIILRGLSYDNGKMWIAKGTTVIACAWLFIYPYLTGEINFTITGLGFGMRARRLFPEGLILLSIPSDRLVQLINNLKEMPWQPISYSLGREGHKRRVKEITQQIKKELGLEE